MFPDSWLSIARIANPLVILTAKQERSSWALIQLKSPIALSNANIGHQVALIMISFLAEKDLTCVSVEYLLLNHFAFVKGFCANGPAFPDALVFYLPIEIQDEAQNLV